MKRDSVPQDRSPTYGGHRKLVYAIDEHGQYVSVQSSGWDTEAQATLLAVDTMNALRDEAWQRARAGATSPLEYHMYQRRMDLATLAQSAGIARWRIRRHFQPQRFAQLPTRLLARYCDALGMTLDELRRLPEQP